MSFKWNAFGYSKGIFRELGIIITCLVLIAGVWLFVEISDQISDKETRSFDQYVLSSLRQADDPTKPVGPEWGTEIARDITALGSKTLLIIIVLSVAGFLFLKKHYGQAWLIIGASLLGVILMSGLKLLFMRERPDIIPHLTATLDPSYPSGHTLMSAVIYLSLAAMLSYFQKSRTLKIYSIIVAIILTFLVGVSRVYLGVHYPTDVLAGWALGFAWAALCWIIFRYFNFKYIHEGKKL
ncbi:MAG: phosphatase PAP2 family protein [Balneolaceae bacterium]|nr:phosphatase PAP2 family protein [Balneolaceae bacterium]